MAARSKGSATLRLKGAPISPMATRWNDALSMVRACDEAHVQLFVVKQKPAQPDHTTAEECGRARPVGRTLRPRTLAA
jgi:hypothetical protein